MTRLLNLKSHHTHLYELVTQKTLEQLISSLYTNVTQSQSNSEEQEWAQYAVEMLLFELLVREKNEMLYIKPIFDEEEEKGKDDDQISLEEKITGSEEDKKQSEPSLVTPLPSLATPLSSFASPLPYLATPLPSLAKPLPSLATPLPSLAMPLSSIATPLSSFLPPSPPLTSLSDKHKLIQALKKKKELVNQVTKADTDKQLSAKSPTYSYSIISSLVDCFLECRLEYIAEIQLQKMAFKTYKCMLDGIQNATSLQYNAVEASTDNRRTSSLGCFCTFLAYEKFNPFPLIFNAFNNVFVAATKNQFVDISSLLQVWNEVFHIVLKKNKHKQIKTLLQTSSSYAPLLSPETQSMFLQELIDINPSGPQMDRWCLYFSIFYLHLKCSKKMGNHCLVIDRQKLFDFLIKCCQLEVQVTTTTTSSDNQKDSATGLVLEKFLSCLVELYVIDSHHHKDSSSDQESSKEKGIQLLFEVIICILRKRLVTVSHLHVHVHVTVSHVHVHCT